MRELSDLLSDDPAWRIVCDWTATSGRTVVVLPATEPNRSETLVGLQVTTRSPMGAVAYETGGLLIDHGWLRVLGSGGGRLGRSILSWNRRSTWTDPSVPPPVLMVADDVLGGVFAINGGALEGELGHAHYFAPDSLNWESLGNGYSDFLHWALTGDIESFYETERWPGWESEVEELSSDQGLSVYPFHFTEGPPIAERSRRAIPMTELFDLQLDIKGQLDGGQ